jgi:phosphomannomutase
MTSFLAFVESQEPKRAAWDRLGSRSPDTTAIDRHLKRILRISHLDIDRIRARGLKVALDCVRGAGGVIIPELLHRLGCEVEGIGLETDGRFPRDPEPKGENLTDLGTLVRETGADVGFAVDPDVDRLSLVDEQGIPLGEDFTLALASSVVLQTKPGVVVTNLSTSQVVDDVARAHGSVVVRAPVGEINVARRMQKEGAVVGGEGNGGVILPELHYTRDAPLGVALILQLLADSEEPVSGIKGAWPGYVIVKEKLTFPRAALGDAYQELKDRMSPPQADESDGLRMAWPKKGAWLHVRPSGTEPVVRLIAEAREEGDARALVKRAAECLEGVG